MRNERSKVSSWFIVIISTKHFALKHKSSCLQQTFELDTTSHDDFERSALDHYRLLMAQEDIIHIGLFYMPSWTLNEPWCVDWVRGLDVSPLSDMLRWYFTYVTGPANKS